MDIDIFLQFDLPSILLGVLAALPCALLGNFLVLRQESLMGDAISHVMLPGIVVGFIISGTTGGAAMMIGAAGAAIVAILLIELIGHMAQIEPGAAMGTVFTAMFAAGVLMLEQFGVGNVHLDVDHALYGSLESAVWLEAEGWSALIEWSILRQLPGSIILLFAVTIAIIAILILLYKELTLASLDPAFAEALGFRPKLMGRLLLFLAAVSAVAAFDAVGSILVIAMFICPAASARCLTTNLTRQIFLSAVFATISGILGYILAGFGPGWIGYEISVSAAGMIAVTAGLIQVIAMMIYVRKSKSNAPVPLA